MLEERGRKDRNSKKESKKESKAERQKETKESQRAMSPGAKRASNMQLQCMKFLVYVRQNMQPASTSANAVASGQQFNFGIPSVKHLQTSSAVKKGILLTGSAVIIIPGEFIFKVH